MTRSQKIITERKNKGLTQEELADLAGVTVRTIQRIESGDNIPRSFTLKAIAKALRLPFDELNIAAEPEKSNTASLYLTTEETAHFLKILCLSCFSYLVIPYVHFLIPIYILKRNNPKDQKAVLFARKVIRKQVSWIIGTILVFLIVLVYNFVQALYLNKEYPVSYLWPFFLMYFFNALLILKDLKRVSAHNQAPSQLADFQ